MELSVAKEKLDELIKPYKSRIQKFGTNISAEVYYADQHCYELPDENDKNLYFLCASITITASDAVDENGMCGFDIVVPIKKNKTVNDAEFEESVAEFKALADRFTEGFEQAPDKDEFIKAESESQKKQYAEEMNQFENSMRKMRSCVIAVGCAVVALLIISMAAAIIFA